MLQQFIIDMFGRDIALLLYAGIIIIFAYELFQGFLLFLKDIFEV